MKSRVGTTFIVAASLLGAAAVAQLVAVLVYFGPGFAPAPAAPDAVLSATVEPAQATPEPTPAPETPDEDNAQANADRAKVEKLLREADALRAGSTPDAALVPLEEAAVLQPKNPEVLQQLASLYERLKQTEMAAETWQKLADLGEEGGRMAEVAKVRLELLQPTAAPEASEVLSLRDQVGLQPGSSLGVINLTVSDMKDGKVPVKDMRLAVKSRPGEPIDAQDVRINVTFFVNLEGEITPDTTSRVQSMWFTTPVDWKDDGIEILEVKYEVPRSGPGGELPVYYGYMVNIYHRGQLQETRSEPANLQELFPPPLTEMSDFNEPEAMR
jgi:hypothetical protein